MFLFAAASLLVGTTLTPAQEVEFRSIDGTGNNVADPQRGAMGQTLKRMSAVAYADGVGAPPGEAQGLPNARVVSNAIFDQTWPALDPLGFSEYVWVWGQFIDHDIDHALLTGTEHIDVPVPEDDPVFAPELVIPVTRSLVAPGTGTGPDNPRQQFNNISAWLDGSAVYGGRAVEEMDTGVARDVWLREGLGGRLKVSTWEHGDLMPLRDEDTTAPPMARWPEMGARGFIAGDFRANEHPALAAMHTLLVRNHNRLAAWIDEAWTADMVFINPQARDQWVYERARRINVAVMQAITYNEFLPTMGIELPPYTGYDPDEDPGVANEFSTAAFCAGHSQINGTLLRLDEDRAMIPAGHGPLFALFFSPWELQDNGGIEPILRGLAHQTQEATDAKIVGSLRNMLFTRGPTNNPIVDASDLVTLDIMRGRDHGLPDYNTVRASYGLETKATFGDVTSDPALAAELAALYGTPDKLDLWVGLLAEDHAPGKAFGETKITILADQFRRIRAADRFWFENDPVLKSWEPPFGLDQYANVYAWVSQMTLSQLIRENSSVQTLQENVFLAEPMAAVIFGGEDLGRGWRGDTWIGELYAEAYPYIWTEAMGWTYVPGKAPGGDGVWLYAHALEGWAWTREDVWPAVYDATAGIWRSFAEE